MRGDFNWFLGKWRILSTMLCLVWFFIFMNWNLTFQFEILRKHTMLCEVTVDFHGVFSLELVWLLRKLVCILGKLKCYCGGLKSYVMKLFDNYVMISIWEIFFPCFAAHSSLDDHLARWFGLNQSKYQWALDDYYENKGLVSILVWGLTSHALLCAILSLLQFTFMKD